LQAHDSQRTQLALITDCSAGRSNGQHRPICAICRADRRRDLLQHILYLRTTHCTLDLLDRGSAVFHR
jgi:hypothetical protein